ncbi:MAG: VWA domain-containing protein [Lachnospiraceae bacterium]|nr:VWA domain-containing protein [Lachnospiraceae bacterium]
MSLIDQEAIARRKMTLFFLIDKSGSMFGSKIGSVNDAIENVLPVIGSISDENPDAEINVAALEFSTGTRWLYDEPKEAIEFIWQQVSASGLTSLGAACRELNSKLSRNREEGGFMESSSGSYAPAIILLSDGGPTDDFASGVATLKNNSWFKNAIKIAIAIGDDADKDVLKEFTGSMEAVLTVHNIEALKAMIRLVAVTSSQIGSKSTSAADTSKQEQVIEEVNKAAADIDGVDTATSADPGYDDWD